MLTTGTLEVAVQGYQLGTKTEKPLYFISGTASKRL
jgi:hypothetical protein